MKSATVWTGMLAAVLLVLEGTMSVRADCGNVDGLEWTYTVSNGEASIGGGERAIPISTMGAITIPSELGGCPVTSIGSRAFNLCSNLTSVAIGAGVKTVGSDAFNACSGLTVVHIDDLAAWCEVSFATPAANPLYYAKHLYLDGNEVALEGDFHIPPGVASIGSYVFCACTNMTGVTIPDSVTKIGEGTFSNCRGLTNVTIGTGVAVVGASAFGSCHGLKAVHIRDLARWCEISFDGGYANPLYFAKHLYLDGEEIPLNGIFRVPDGVTRIGSSVFADRSALTGVVIPDGVADIGAGAFSGCSGLVDVAIPDGVTSIGDLAFSSCTNLAGISIPDSVTDIGYSAFYNCQRMKQVTIGRGVTNIGGRAFLYCSRLTAVRIRDLAAWCEIDFQGYKVPRSNEDTNIYANPLFYARRLYLGDEEVTDVEIPEGMAVVGRAFAYCDSLASVSIPEGVTELAPYAFCGCSGLTNALLPNSMTNIGRAVFRDCAKLEALVIPGNLKGIGEAAFYGCSNLVSMTVPDSVSSIGGGAFANCPRLRNVHVGKKAVVEPGFSPKSLFDGCTRLTAITVDAGNPQYASDDGVFYLRALLENPILCPKGKSGTYVIPDCVTSLDAVYGSTPFSSCTKLDSIVIPPSVTAIGEMAFWNCSGLMSVPIPDSVTNIGSSAFGRCTGLRSLAIPRSVTGIGGSAFQYCTSLTNLALPASVRSIGYHAFYGSGLKTLRVPAAWEGTSMLANTELPSGCEIVYCNPEEVSQEWDYTIENGEATVAGVLPAEGYLSIPDMLGGCPVVAIGNMAFQDCAGLTVVRIPSGVANIGNGAFSGCTGLRTVVVPDSVASVGSGVFSGCIGLETVRVPASWRGTDVLDSAAIPVGCKIVCDALLPEVKWSCAHVYTETGGTATVTGVEPAVGDLTMPESLGGYPVTAIDADAFFGCSGLTGMDIANSVTNIGSRAFAGCTGLQELVIPDSVVLLGSGVFTGCEDLVRLEVPGAWEGGGQLEDADVPEGCEVVYRRGGSGPEADGTDTIDGVEWRYEVSYDGNAIVKGAEPADGALVIPAMLGGHPVTGIGDSAFEDCERLTSVVIQDGVAWLGYGAFRGCVRLESASNPSSLAEIGQYAFENCGRLASLELPEGVERIGDGAFAGCSGLTDVSIPDSVASIGDGAFMECDGIRDTVSITGIVLVDGWVVGYDYDMLPDNLDLSGVRGLADDGLAWAGLRSVILPEDLRAIGAGAFHNCYSLESVSIPDSVVRIGDSAFSSCSALAGIEVGAGNTAFSSMDGVLFDKEGKTLLCCPGGKSGTYVLPAGVEGIAWLAFAGCSGLTDLILPDSLENLDGSGVFYTCGALETLEAPISWKEKHFDYYGESLFWTEYAEVPEGCTVTYRDAPAQTETEDSPVPIPFAWLETEAADILAAAGGDHEAAALAPAANGLPVWQCYVAGLSTTEPEAEFKVKSISFADGEVQIRWSPDLNENGTKTNRTYTVEGKPAMTNEWGPRDPSSRFFRVRVELPPQ